MPSARRIHLYNAALLRRSAFSSNGIGNTYIKIILNHKELNVKRKSGFVLMKERFKSENIENENYLLTAIRYIHQNPLNPGIVTVKVYKSMT